MGPLKYLFNNYIIYGAIYTILYLFMFHYLYNIPPHPKSLIRNYFIDIVALITLIILNKKKFVDILGSVWCFLAIFMV